MKTFAKMWSRAAITIPVVAATAWLRVARAVRGRFAAGGRRLRDMMRFWWSARPIPIRSAGCWTKLASRARHPAIAVALVVLAWLCLPKPPLLENVAFSQRVFDRSHNLLRMTLTTDQKFRIYTPLAGISPDLIHATLLHEDRFFYGHFGINVVSAARSAVQFCTHGNARAGASTITMQLARMRFRINTRTLKGKALQMLRALELERHYTKAQILEAYFNLAPYGGNIEGIGAASEIYFGKPPLKLTRPEAVALSVVPQSPARRAPQRGRGNDSLAAAQRRLSMRLAAPDGGLFRAQVDAPRQFLAPHFTERVLVETASRETRTEIVTTLDLDWQRILERRIAGYIAANQRLGISNASAMLVDARTMDVLAEVGSANFFDEAICGQVDGTRSMRSPGSTLKPFVYALAMDQGLIHPLSVLKDAPRSFGSYNPENFDREFVGPIRAADALARSRNIPAIALCSELSHPTFYEFLKTAGVDLPRDAKSYGLTLPLGGAEVTMADLVRLYAMLANGGRLRSLQRTLPHDAESGTRLISPEAAFLTLEMLGRIPRPSIAGDAPDAVFWKTGTSNGFRDAWSVSVFDHYVLAVWVGNFDGRGNPAFVGRTCAGPLLFQIIDAMRATGSVHFAPLEPPPGANLQRVEFCAVSGQLPTAACAHRVSGWYMPGISPIATCDVHREVLVDVETGLRVPADDGSRKIRREVHEFWPSDLLDLFSKAGLPRRSPPPFWPGTEVETAARKGNAPQIVSPRSSVIYTIRASDEGNRSVALRAETDADVAKLYWFADKMFLGESGAREALYWQPKPGSYTIVAMDDLGRSAQGAVTVQCAEAN